MRREITAHWPEYQQAAKMIASWRLSTGWAALIPNRCFGVLIQKIAWAITDAKMIARQERRVG